MVFSTRLGGHADVHLTIREDVCGCFCALPYVFYFSIRKMFEELLLKVAIYAKVLVSLE